MIFLEAQALNNAAAGSLFGAFFAIILAFFLIFLLIGVGLYIYISFAFMAIARKAKYSSPGIAWIPGIGPLIIINSISKMHWWPFLLFIGLVIPFINFLAMVAIGVFSIIWLWKTYEAIDKPGWWALLNLITPVGLVMIGIAAWSKK